MSAEKIIGALIRAYEQQNNVKVKYKIISEPEEEKKEANKKG